MSYSRLIYHIVFRPKGSAMAITDLHAEELYRQITGFVRSRDGVVYRTGGMPDHIHLLVQLPATLAVADFMRDLKTSAAKFMAAHPARYPLFQGWARSYCAISVSASRLPVIARYIERQKEHHTHKSFADELREICQEYDINIDERYFLKD